MTHIQCLPNNEAGAHFSCSTHTHAHNTDYFLSRVFTAMVAAGAGSRRTHYVFVLVSERRDVRRSVLFLLVLILDGVLLVILLRVIWLPSAGREDVLVPLIPSAHHHFACRREKELHYPWVWAKATFFPLTVHQGIKIYKDDDANNNTKSCNIFQSVTLQLLLYSPSGGLRFIKAK